MNLALCMYRRWLFLGLLLSFPLGLAALLQGCGSTTPPPKTAESLKIQWVKVAGGDFLMGSSGGDVEEDEKPQHRVQLSSFWMSATEVTNAQYDMFLAAMEVEGGQVWEAVKESGSRNPGLDDALKGADQPVAMVSYGDAQAFCRWLGHSVALPTEAQWEYACRAGSSTRYGFGDELAPDQANIDGSIWREDGADVGGRARAVAQYRANAFGLYDMHGNVWEWCADWYDDGYYQTCMGRGTEGRRGTDPAGPAAGAIRVLRGGSWGGYAEYCRAANRLGDSAWLRYEDVGFRLVAPVAP
ncbi:MAG: serine/threonine protein kinase [Bacteroidetes bacterium]|nr:MAG: serine/threonine protein kinase [Bacteroidota bacterium]